MKKFIASKSLSIVLLLLYATLLAVATFVEDATSTARAREVIYHSPLLFALQALMVINFIAIFIKGRYFAQRRWGMLTLHTAFIVMLVGAFITFASGREGVMHLREGELSSTMVIQTPDRQEIVPLPFEIELTKFVLERYPGSMSPSSYESYITIYGDGEEQEGHIYMNNTLDIKGYRLFQASYDEDERGSILLVNQDVLGRRVTYLGYLLLGVGFLLSLFGRNGRASSLFRALSKIKSAAPILFLLFTSLGATAQSDNYLDIVEEHIVPEEQAAKFGALPMQDSRGRFIPINTFASEVVRKLHKEKSIGRLNPEQFLLSLYLMPDVWVNIPFIASEDSYCSYVDMFDEDENYILQPKLNAIYEKSAAERTAEDKEVLALDERVNIFNQIINYQMVNIFPDQADTNHKWYAAGDDLSHFEGGDSMFVSQIFPWYLSEVGKSVANNGSYIEADKVLEMIQTYQRAKGESSQVDMERIEAEIKYNSLNPFAKSRLYYLILGGLLLVLSIVELLSSRRRVINIVKLLLGAGVLVVFHFHMYGIGLRWFIAGYAPWSNSYETMVYIAWIVAMAGILFARRNTFVFAVATLFAGVVLFVSGLSWMNPQITPLVPVLKSAWLMFHVAVIVAAYGLFGVSAMLGLTNMVLMIVRGGKESQTIDRAIEELTIINEISLWFGLALMTAGTFLGAIWANESWGRYWGWDPKETWALITMVVYAVVTHLYMVKKIYSVWLFNFASVIAMLSVIMTYFGVNFFFSGMHSYNSTTLSSGILYMIGGVVVLLIAGGVIAKIRYRTLKL